MRIAEPAIEASIQNLDSVSFFNQTLDDEFVKKQNLFVHVTTSRCISVKPEKRVKKRISDESTDMEQMRWIVDIYLAGSSHDMLREFIFPLLSVRS